MFGKLIDILKKSPKKIVFTEGTDPRILEASARLLSGTFLTPILVGKEEEIRAAAEEADAPEAPQAPTGTVPPANAVPLYSSPQSAPQPPQPVRPKGPSAGTIVLGVIVLLCGVLTIAVGVSMSSATFVFFPNMQHFTAYLFAGVGGLLCVLAVVWAIASAIGKRRREQTSPIHESKGARIDR